MLLKLLFSLFYFFFIFFLTNEQGGEMEGEDGEWKRERERMRSSTCCFPLQTPVTARTRSGWSRASGTPFYISHIVEFVRGTVAFAGKLLQNLAQTMPLFLWAWVCHSSNHSGFVRLATRSHYIVLCFAHTSISLAQIKFSFILSISTFDFKKCVHPLVLEHSKASLTP